MAQELSGNFWKLTHFVKNKALEPVIPGTRLTAYFNKRGMVTGSGGCNQYGANYHLLPRNPPGIVITDLISTQMYCSEPKGIMEQEERYFRGLLAATDIDLKNGKLELSWKNGGLVFEAEEIKKH